MEIGMKGLFMAMALIAIASPAPAHAETTDSLITRAIDLRKSNRDQEALPLLVKAVDQEPSARAIAHLGTCEQALGLWVQAEAHIQTALAKSGDPWIQKNETVLRKALEAVQSRIGSLDIWGSPAGAKVSVDGDFVSTLPMARPIRSLLGTRTIAVSAAGFVTESRQIEVRKGVFSVREHVALRPIALTPGGEPPAISIESEVPTSKAKLTNPEKSSSEPTATPIYRKWWFWSAIALTTIAAGTAAILLTRHNESCAAPMGGTCTTF